MGDEPRKKREAAMTHEEFRALLASSGLTTREAAELLGVNHATVSRWQTAPPKRKGARGGTPISKHSAKLIRMLFEPKT